MQDFTEELRARLATIERKIDALGELREDPSAPRLGHLAEAFRGMDTPLQPSHVGGGVCGMMSDNIAAGANDAKSTCLPDGEAPVLMADMSSEAMATAAGASNEQSDVAGAGSMEQEDKPQLSSTLSRGRTAWSEFRSRTAWSDGMETDLSTNDKPSERERSRVTFSASREQMSQVKYFVKRFGLDKTMESLRKALDDPSALRGWGLIHNSYFNSICSIMIVLNAFFIGYSNNVMLQAAMQNEPPPSGLLIVEVLFAIFFTCELIVRGSVERWLFFIGPEFKWNIFDLVLVNMSILDLILYMSGSGANTNLTLARVFRVFRFFRLARLSRVIKQFGALRLVLYAILDSMSSLFWCFVVIGLAIYIFAVLFVSAAAEHFVSVGGAAMDDTSQLLRESYGGLAKTTVTLFKVISGGIDWGDAMLPVEQIHPLYVPVFIFYVFVMHFGVLNVVIGTFVATATEIASKDREALVKYELRQWQVYTERIKTFFQEADEDKSGTLSWEEFRSRLEDQKVRAYFQTLDLDVSQAHVLFELLDADGSNSVTIDEFLDGCMRLKGQAKSIDLNMLLYMNKKVFDQMSLFMKWTEQKCSLVEERLGIERSTASPPAPSA